MLLVSALIEPAAGGTGHRVIASRSLEAGERQLPWLLRLDPDDHLLGGVNVEGTRITLCRSTVAIVRGRSTRVGMVHDERTLILLVDDEEVARCPAPGPILNTTGTLVIGALKNVPNPGPEGPVHQTFAGTVSVLELQDEPGPRLGTAHGGIAIDDDDAGHGG